MFNQDSMQNMMWGLIGQQFSSLSPEVKEALSQVEIDIVRYPDRLLVVSKSIGANPYVDQARQNLVDSLAKFVPEYLSRAFKVKVKIFENE